MHYKFILSFAMLLLITNHNAGANDSSASIAQGGLVYIKEPRISMETEELTITPWEVAVKYTFRNTTDKDITTLVAFPDPGPFPLENFTVFNDGIIVNHQTEVKALVAGEDRTADIKKLGIDPVAYLSLGNRFSQHENLNNLDPKLVDAAYVSELFNSDLPKWKLNINYYWKQTFNKNSLNKIAHKYAPVPGQFYFTASSPPTATDNHIDRARLAACIGEEGFKWIATTFSRLNRNHDPKSTDGGELIFVNYVDYILMTANNWLSPIKSFYAKFEGVPGGLVCVEFLETNYNGTYSERKIGQTGKAITFEHANYAPAENIRVYFLAGATEAGDPFCKVPGKNQE